MKPAQRIALALYAAFGLSVGGVYALAETSSWWRARPVVHASIVPSVRTPPGEYGSGGSGGSGAFWHSGSHGGK